MLLPKPNLHKAGPGTEKHIKRGAKALFSLLLLPPSPPCDGATFSLHLWINVPSHLKDGFSCYYLNKQSCNTDLFNSYNTVHSRPESYNTVCPLRAVTRQGALMSVTPNFCCDETKNRGAYTRVTKVTK